MFRKLIKSRRKKCRQERETLVRASDGEEKMGRRTLIMLSSIFAFLHKKSKRNTDEASLSDESNGEKNKGDDHNEEDCNPCKMSEGRINMDEMDLARSTQGSLQANRLENFLPSISENNNN